MPQDDSIRLAASVAFIYREQDTMPTVAQCPGCQTKLSIPDALLGKPIKCVKCGKVLAIANPAVSPNAVIPAPATRPVAPAPPQSQRAVASTPRSAGSARLWIGAAVVAGLFAFCLLIPAVGAALWLFTRSELAPVQVTASDPASVIVNNPAPVREAPEPEAKAKLPDAPKNGPAPLPEAPKAPTTPPVVPPAPAPNDPPTKPPQPAGPPQPTRDPASASMPPMVAGIPERAVNGRPFKDWISELSSRNVQNRRNALFILQQQGPNAIWALPQVGWLLLNDPDAEVRTTAARVCGALQSWGEPAVPLLIETLGDRDEAETVRTACVDALASIRAPAAVPALIALFKDPALKLQGAGNIMNTPKLGEKTVGALAAFGSSAVGPLTEALKENDADIRQYALSTLLQMGPEAKPAAAAVARLQNDPNVLIRGIAKQVIAKIEPSAIGDMGVLRAGLKNESKAVKLEAMDRLSRIGPAALPALPELMLTAEDPDWMIRRNAISTIGAIGPKANAAVPALVKAAKDKVVGVRYAAADALAYVGADSGSAVPVLAEMLSDVNPDVASRAASSLEAFGADARPAMGALLEQLKKQVTARPQFGVPTTALRWMGPEAAKLLAETLADKDARIRFLAIVQLQHMGIEAEPALPALRKALHDDDRGVRFGALQTIAGLGQRAHPVADELLNILGEQKSERTALVLTTLNRIGLDGRDMERILAMTRDSSLPVRTAAVRALAACGEDGLKELGKLQLSRDVTVQATAKQALAEGQKQVEIRQLLKQLEGRDAAERRRAAGRILQLDDQRPEPIPVLTAALRDPAVPVAERVQAAVDLKKAKAKLGSWARIQDLREACKDPPPQLREALHAAFLRLDGVQANMAGVKFTAPKPEGPAVAALPPPPVKFERMPTRVRGSSSPPISTVVRYFVPNDAARAKGARPVFVLERPFEGFPITAGSQHGILARELARQAFAMAAREGLGLPVRDLSFRDNFAPSPAYMSKAMFVLTSSIRPSKSAELAIRLGGLQGKLLWRSEIPLPAEKYSEYPRLLEELERIARTEWVNVLKENGVEPLKMPAVSEARAPAAVSEQLDSMNYLSQYIALRQLHEQERKEGPSPWLTADLARGYANLGVLTEFHLNSAHKIARARSLLYAQRLVAMQPKSPWGYWQRGYAHALLGAHAAALADLDQADQLAATAKTPAAPGWVADVRAYCRFDGGKLKGRPGQLAQLLAFLAVEDLSTVGHAVTAAEALLGDNPECTRVFDGVCRIAGVSAGHQYTTQAFVATSKSLAKRLPQMPGLPPAAAEAVKATPSDEKRVLQAMLDGSTLDGDTAEPSCSSVAWAVRDTRLSQVCARLYFMKINWGVPTDEFIDEASKIVAQHPYAGLLDLYSDREERRKTGIMAKARADAAEIELSQKPPLFEPNAPVSMRSGMQTALAHMDPIYRDLRTASTQAAVTQLRTSARELATISPYAPFARAFLIKEDWAAVQNRVAEWEKEGQPLVLRALGQHYRRQAQFDAAERCFKEYLQVAPDYDGYSDLAELYKQQKKMDKFQETLEESLKIEDIGLNHAQARVRIARELMEQKQYRKALPFAEAAADSYAAWAMLCACECNEALGELDRAELWVRRVSERYPGSRAAWFQWCKKTGHGDVEAARKVAER
jgi:HEAT repeat protein/tetratricopeptide (TPR) repeat protein